MGDESINDDSRLPETEKQKAEGVTDIMWLLLRIRPAGDGVITEACVESGLRKVHQYWPINNY